MTRKLGRKRRARGEEPLVSPMDGVANMADAMLVLAVGIMLALVVNWNVDLATVAANHGVAVSKEEAIPFDQSELQSAGEEVPLDQESMTRMGTVYFDEASGNYYIIRSED